jgi:hypothetical protein
MADEMRPGPAGDDEPGVLADSGDYRVRVTLTSGQLRLLEAALDLYTRLGIGQTDILPELYDAWGLRPCSPRDPRDPVAVLAMELKKQLLGPEYEGASSLGIANRRVHGLVKSGYDLQKALQFAVALAEGHRHSTWNSGDFLHLGLEPTPEMVLVRRGGETPVDAATHRGSAGYGRRSGRPGGVDRGT